MAAVTVGEESGMSTTSSRRGQEVEPMALRFRAGHSSASSLDVTVALRRYPGDDGLELALTLTPNGEIDVANCAEFDALLRMVESLGLPVVVDLGALRFADSEGLAPLVESTRRRHMTGGPPLRVAALGGAAGRIFGLLGVKVRPEIDVAAWDAASAGTPTVSARTLSGRDRDPEATETTPGSPLSSTGDRHD